LSPSQFYSLGSPVTVSMNIQKKHSDSAEHIKGDLSITKRLARLAL
jgi:hypothetical protein